MLQNKQQCLYIWTTYVYWHVLKEASDETPPSDIQGLSLPSRKPTQK